MTTFRMLSLYCFMLFAAQGFSQNFTPGKPLLPDTIQKDTLHVILKTTEAARIQKGTYKLLLLSNLLSEPWKKYTLQIISSKGNTINQKSIQLVGDYQVLIPIEAITDQYYTIYVKDGKLTILEKRLVFK